jgi:hypothetical protein
MIVPLFVEVLGECCFYECRLLSSITFESGSRLKRIEQNAVGRSGLVEIIVPSSVNLLGERCFGECKSLFSVTFEPESRLKKIERRVLYQAGWFRQFVDPKVRRGK